MSIPRSVLLLLILLCLPCAVYADGFDWMTDSDAALQRARAERKVVVVQLDRPTRKLTEAETHAMIAKLVPAFVFLRADRKRFPVEFGHPSMLAVTCTGEVVAQRNLVQDGNALFGFLADLVGIRSLILAAGEARTRGATGDAEMALGMLESIRLLNHGDGFVSDREPFQVAVTHFRKAADSFGRESRPEDSERARMWLMLWAWGEGALDLRVVVDPYIDLRKAVEKASSPRVAAEGWLVMGIGYERERRLGKATDAYQHALLLAEPGSNVAEIARYALDTQQNRFTRKP